MRDDAEIALLEAAKTGDAQSVRRLRAALEKPIRRFVYRLIGPGNWDDIVQDAFVAVYINLERIEPPENLRPFLFRIVRNLCYDELRRRGRFEPLPPDEGAEIRSGVRPPPVDRRPAPDAQVERLLLRSELWSAIERLPELQRQSLLLYGEEEMSYAQIATATGTDIGTVKSRLYYARRNLMRLLPPQTLAALGVEKGD